jgi:hypothetical protein
MPRPRKIKLEERTIFPMSCEKGHNYQPLRKNCDTGDVDGYYKHDSDDERINSTVYCLLYCNLCGGTKEISMINRR